MRAKKEVGSAIRGQRGLRALGFGLVLLGVCVFAWGLRYKLSLYQSPHAAVHHMAVAKLFPGKERSALPDFDVRGTDHRDEASVPLLSFAFVLLLGSVKFHGLSRWAATFPIVLPVPDRIAIRANFSRPPPRYL